MAINIISCIRGFYSGELLVNNLIFNIVNLIFFYLVGQFALVLEKKNKITSSLYLGILFYAVIDVFLLYSSTPLLGFQSETIFDNESAGSINSLATFFGFQSNRVIFPLASFSWGATHLGSIIGIIYVASWISVIYTTLDNKSRFFKHTFKNFFWFAIHFVSIVVSFWIMILADSRAAFFSSFISVSTFLILKFLLIRLSFIKVILKHVPHFFISFYLFNFLYMYFKDFLAYILETTNLYRGDNTSAFSYRDIIWDSVLKFLAEFSPEHIIGYGVWGQYVAGINKSYESLLFSNFTSDHFTLHSTILQQLIDTGYLGIFVYISLTFFVLKSSAIMFLKKISYNSNYPQSDLPIFSSVANLGVLFYLIRVGSADPVITIERLFSMNIYIILVMCSLTSVPSNAR